MAELQFCEQQDHGKPAGEDFKDIPVDVPERIFDRLMPIMIHRVAVLVNGRPAVITHCGTRGRPSADSIPCAVAGRYIHPAGGVGEVPRG